MLLRVGTTVLVSLVSLVVLAVSAFGSSSPEASDSDPESLAGTWTLASIAETGQIRPADPAVSTDLTLGDGTASGTGGVNRFSTTYQASAAGTISFARLASTRMAGPERAMRQEGAFFFALAAVERFEIRDGELVLGDGGGDTVAVLVRH